MTTTARARAAEKRASSRRRDRKREPTGYRYSAAGVRFGVFAFTFLRHTKGRWARDPLGMSPWQLEVMSELLQRERETWAELTIGDLERPPEELWRDLRRWMLDADPGGLRVHREGLLGVPKKNGKSTISSGLALYLLVGDDEDGPEVYSLASARKQAHIVFDEAAAMVRASPLLLERLRVQRSEILYPERDGKYAVLSADADVAEGINPSGAVADEIHAQKQRALYDTVKTAMLAREQPLLFAITTAAVAKRDKTGELTLLGDLYQRGAGAKPRYRLRRLNPGLAKLGHKTELSEVATRADKRRRFYYRWFEVPWRHRENERYWLAANPSPWIDGERLREESDDERPRGIFYRYHCNIFSRVERHWLKPGAWAKCKAPRVRPAAGLLEALGRLGVRPPDPVVCAVDAALGYDLAALVVGGLGEKLPVRAKVWGLEPDPRTPPPPAHELLAADTIDLDLVEEQILAVAEAGYRIAAVGADPAKFNTQLVRLEQRFEVVRFSQGSDMVLASEILFREIGGATVQHDGDIILETHLENATIKDVGGGGRFRLDKRGATEKMDAAVALAIFVFLARDPEIGQGGRPSVTVL